MKTLSMAIALAATLALVPLVNADHDAGCEPTSADPSTINQVDLPDGTTYYFEERGVPEPFNTVPPIPESGFWLGDGSWWYQESNGVPGLQRGGTGLTGDCFPADGDLCLIIDTDPLNDENCGHGPDTLIW